MNPCKDFGHHNSNILLENVLFFKCCISAHESVPQTQGCNGAFASPSQNCISLNFIYKSFILAGLLSQKCSTAPPSQISGYATAMNTNNLLMHCKKQLDKEVKICWKLKVFYLKKTCILLEQVNWNILIKLTGKNIFFTGNKLHEIFLDLPENMSFFTGQFIQSQFKCVYLLLLLRKM